MTRWLDAAADALPSCDGRGQSEIRHTLLVVRQDYINEPRESRTIGVAVAQAPERVELRDATLASKELAVAVTSVLQTYRAARTTTWERAHPSGSRTRFGNPTPDHAPTPGADSKDHGAGACRAAKD